MTSLSIHTSVFSKDGKFWVHQRHPSVDNKNCIGLEFQGQGEYSDSASVMVSGLDAVTAECLARIGQMTVEQRAEAVPELRRIMGVEVSE